MNHHLIATLFAILCWTATHAQGLSGISEEDPLDLTSLVANAKCQNAPGWQHHGGEQAGTGGSNYAKTVALFNSADYNGSGIETWTSAPVTNTDLIFQDLTLPAGQYELSACVVAQVYVSDTQHGANNGGISLFMGDKQIECKSNTWKRLSLQVSVPQNGIVRIGVKAGATNRNTWIALADVHLKMTALTGNVQPLALNEKYDTYPTNAGMLANVLLNKYLPADHPTTLCLPFALSEAKTSELFASVQSITSATAKGNEIAITTRAESSIEAGKAYIVVARKAIEGTLDLGPVLLGESHPAEVSFGGITLRGNYRVYEHVANSYTLNAEGTAFIPAEGRGRMKGFGAFMVK